jgi:hypothetical protein
MRATVLGLGLALANVSSGWAQSAWQAELAQEIVRAQACEVAYLSHVVERVVDGKQVIIAKVHCVDGRVFDASRMDELESFQFNECRAEATTAC